MENRIRREENKKKERRGGERRVTEHTLDIWKEGWTPSILNCAY